MKRSSFGKRADGSGAYATPRPKMECPTTALAPGVEFARRETSMKTALLYEEHDLRTFVVVLQSGDEAMSALESFAREHRVRASQFTAIGAFERAVIAYFDWGSKQY